MHSRYPAAVRYGAAIVFVLLAALFRGLLDPWLGDSFPFGTLFIVFVGLVLVLFAEATRRAQRRADGIAEELRVARDQFQREIAQRKREEQEREHTAMQHARQHEFLEKLVESATVAIAVVHGPEFRFILANSGFQEATGRRDEPILGRTLAEIFPEAFFEGGVGQLVREAYEIGRAVAVRELELSLGPGQEHTWWNGEYVPMRNEAGQVDSLLILIRNVTEEVLNRRHAEALAAAAHAQRRQLATILNSVYDAIVLHDAEGNILDLNEQMLRMYGVTREDLGRLSIAGDLSAASNPLEQLPQFWRKALDGRAQLFPWVARQPHTGLEFDVEVFLRKLDLGDREVIMANIRDVTERKRTEEELRHHVERLQILSTVTSNLLVSEKPQEIVEDLCTTVMRHLGCDVFFNFLADESEGGLRLNACGGISPQQARSLEWIDYGETICGQVAKTGLRIVLENISTSMDPLASVVRSLGLQAYACQPLLIQRKLVGTLSFGSKSKTRFTEDELSLMRAVADHVAIAVERVRLMESIEQRAEEAQAANKAKGQFLANISHELRTPMNAILGMTELSLGEDLSPTVRDYLQTVKDSADVLLLLLNEILDFSRIEAGRFSLDLTPLNLHTLIQETVRSLGVRAYEKGLEMACDIAANVPDLLVGDRLRLRQVLVNLLGNAIKFTARGEVVLRAGVVEQTADDVLLEFVVSDTGVGISTDDQARIFDPFTQADASMTRGFGGTGLGLTIAANLVEMMGGKIEVESQLGDGSSFRFTSRLKRQPACEPPRAIPLVLQSLRGIRVLVAEGHPAGREILAKRLAEWGMMPETAADGESALRILQESAAAGKRFSLVFLDVALPGIDGRCLADTISRKAELAAVVVLLVSPATRLLKKNGCDEKQSHVCLEKPVLPPDLLRAIARAMGVNLMGESSRPANGAPAAAELPVQPLKILLAEDTPANQKLVARILNKRGHAVAVAEDGQKAVEMAASDDFDVVLMDVQMPTMDGFQATAGIRALPDSNKAGLPIIAMTAHAMKGDEERCLAAGMDAYITKPLNSRDLIELIESMIRKPV